MKEIMEKINSMHNRAMKLIEMAILEKNHPSGNKYKMINNLKLAYSLESQVVSVLKGIIDVEGKGGKDER
jgi:hypothetical protein